MRVSHGPFLRRVLPLVLAASLAGSAGVARATTWHVPGDAETIQGGIDLAAPGDDVIVGPGTYLESGIRMKSGVLLHSEAGPEATIVDGQRLNAIFYCVDCAEQAVIDGFTIRNGQSSDGYWGGFLCERSLVAIRDCIIRDSWPDAIVILDTSDVEVEGCRIEGCHAALFTEWSIVRVTDCVVRDNRYGLGGYAFDLTVSRCVITRNVPDDGEGWGIGVGLCQLRVEDTEVTANRGSGIMLSESTSSIIGCTIAHNWVVNGEFSGGIVPEYSTVHLERTIVYGNEGAYSDNCPPGSAYCSLIRSRCDDLGGNFWEDPLFCDAEGGDYRLDALSPCLPGNHPDGDDCGLIGAYGMGCSTHGACCVAETCILGNQQDCDGEYLGDGVACDPNPCVASATQSTTWGRLRSMFR
ncbi:MAG: nitrous oxide reductase family maturation protein NosD [Candidatus Eisenbacteria bacterium]|nr:right-handed parallel beta-helix repeat-containing protein [Candidatus Eisenbacteria bacterium]